MEVRLSWARTSQKVSVVFLNKKLAIIAQYYLVPETDSSVIFTIELNIYNIQYFVLVPCLPFLIPPETHTHIQDQSLAKVRDWIYSWLVIWG